MQTRDCPLSDFFKTLLCKHLSDVGTTASPGGVSTPETLGREGHRRAIELRHLTAGESDGNGRKGW
jgi:hypothetical protein